MLNTVFGKSSKGFLDDYFPGINIIESSRFLKVNPKVEHENFNMEGIDLSDRYLLTKQLIDRAQSDKILIFCNSTERCIELAKYLQGEGIVSEPFHSKQLDNERSAAVYRFHTGKTVCLVCTDIAARGMDFKDVRLVMQFEYADNGINLLHRIGRTGRMNTAGKGLALVISSDKFGRPKRPSALRGVQQAAPGRLETRRHLQPQPQLLKETQEAERRRGQCGLSVIRCYRYHCRDRS